MSQSFLSRVLLLLFGHECSPSVVGKFARQARKGKAKIAIVRSCLQRRYGSQPATAESFGMVAVTSTSRNIPPAINPSRNQPSGLPPLLIAAGRRRSAPDAVAR